MYFHILSGSITIRITICIIGVKITSAIEPSTK